MKHRTFTDPILCMTLTLGVGEAQTLARVSWTAGSCYVDARDLSLGRWTPVKLPGCPEQTPPIAVACRATALAVGAWNDEPHGAVVEDDDRFCAVCGLPLEEHWRLGWHVGCTRGNCRQKPRPDQLYAPRRAEMESHTVTRQLQASVTAQKDFP